MDHQVRTLGEKYLLSVGGDVAVRLLDRLRTNDFEGIIATRVNPRLYEQKILFARDYLSAELLRKFPGFPVDIDRKAVARKGFWRSEGLCWRTNRRLDPYLSGFGLTEEAWTRRIARMRKKIREWIGSKPPEFAGDCDFGPGATYDCTGKNVLPADKIEAIPTRTKDLFSDISFLWCFGTTLWSRASRDVKLEGATPDMQCRWTNTLVVPGNRFTCVPKDSEKDRGICIEPTLNVYIQKGLGLALRRLLKRAGIDLARGQKVHGVLAEWASRHGHHFCTLDLSSASDTVALFLVELLLPKLWFEALSAARSPTTEVDGKIVRLGKFSSMGNGYTFELETLIFAAICSTREEGDLTLGVDCFVYGDDIIVPTKFSKDVQKDLEFFGFELNPRKSFTTGFFRESCGTDAFDGLKIPSFRIDSEPDGPGWWISAANAVRRSLSILPEYPTDREIRRSPAWRYCVSQIPLKYRYLIGPERLGDAVLHYTDYSEAVYPGEGLMISYPRDKRFSPGTSWVRALSSVTEPVPWKHWSKMVQLATRLMHVGDHSQGHVGRDCPVTLRVGWVSVS